MMAKEKKIALTPEEYWEWRTTIAEMQCAEEKIKSAKLEAQLLQKNAEIGFVKAQLFMASNVRSANDSHNESKNEYVKFKSSIEQRLGVDLSGKIISDVNFEVLDDPEGAQDKKVTKNNGEK